MADVCGKVNVNCERAVCRIHETLKGKIHELSEKKFWSSKQKEEFEKKLTEVYRDAVEESVKKNVSVQGKDWSDSCAGKGESSVCAVEEEIEPLNKERLEQVNKSWGELEDLIRVTTSKRKHCPAQMTQALKKTLQCHKEMLETFEPIIKSDPYTPRSVALDREDAEETLEQRLQTTVTDVSQFSKSFPELQGKTDRLLQAMQSHRAMQECNTNAVLFGNERETTHQKLRSASHTPEARPVSDIVKSFGKSKTGRSSRRKPQVKRKSRNPSYNET